MREIFLSKNFIEQTNPSKKNSLEKFSLINYILSPASEYRIFPEGYRPDGTIIPLYCNLILTNKTFDGIWLISDDVDNSITIPGGRICEEELPLLKSGDSYVAIYKTINRRLCERNTAVSAVANFNFPMEELMRYLVDSYGLTIDGGTNFPIAYHYKEGEMFSIYLIKVVDEPTLSVPSFSNFMTNRGMIWYSRKEHYSNIRTPLNRASLFNSKYENDIRVSDAGVEILDSIFQTENLFGKLDIY